MIAARWLALAAAAAAAAGFAAGPGARPALADSAVTVTTTADETTASDGTCSLREAILYAENETGGDTDCGVTATGTTTINLPAGTYDASAPGSNEHLDIQPGRPGTGTGTSSGPIVIAGAGTTATVIDAGGNLLRLLAVEAGATATIKNLTLRGGDGFGTPGGGILNAGTLTLDHVTVTANTTEVFFGAIAGTAQGGGIYNTGTLNLLNSVVSGNSTSHGGAPLTLPPPFCGAPGDNGSPGGDGGGLYNQGGTVTAINTIFTDNHTGAGGSGADGRDSSTVSGCIDGGNGGSGAHGGDGGAIFNNGTLTLADSAVYGNTTGAGGYGGNGGSGQHLGGFGGEGGGGGAGAGIVNNDHMRVINTTITGNTTGNGTAGGAGGASGTPGTDPNTGGLGGAGGPGSAIYQENVQGLVQESTIALNNGGLGAGTQGINQGPGISGIEVVAGFLNETDTIISGDDCLALPGGQIRDGLTNGDGHVNLTFPTGSCPGVIANPLLGPLHDNGGPTPTMAIAPPSPAIDRVPPIGGAGCTQTDQRGIRRATDGKCDIGAYEYVP